MATSTLGSGTLVLAGTTSGTTTVTATAVAGTTTLTLPAATDTLVGKATTDTLTNKTLTGAVMNGTVGATTPATGAFTTLSANSTVTLSGGTINGVAYLNGSNVLTTGSALAFDGSKLDILRSSTTTNAFDESEIRAINTGAATINQRVDVAMRFQDGTYNGTGGISMIRESATARSGALSLSSIDSSGNPTNGIRLSSTGAVALFGASTSATGVGITFPATQSASSNANTLDDYEEGTWTPTFVSTTGTNPTVTYGNQYGYYVKVGRMVHINMYLTASVITGGTGWLTVAGLPFATDSSTANYGAVAVAGIDNIPMAGGETQYGLRVSPGGSTMLFLLLKANTASGIVDLTGVSQGGVTAGGTYISA